MSIDNCDRLRSIYVYGRGAGLKSIGGDWVNEVGAEVLKSSDWYLISK